ncbi:MAG TPA: PqqD family protein [Oligoflexia bacterium]|nr:PqqD family protein [Oligoflexia bacterium]
MNSPHRPELSASERCSEPAVSGELPERVSIFSEDIGWRKTGNDYVVVHMAEGSYYVFRNSASFIWERLIEGKPPLEILLELKAVFSADSEILRADLAEFLEQLHSRKLVCFS